MWIALVAGAGVAVLGGAFVWLGLEQADQLASVLGTFTGLAGLGLSGYSVLLSSRNGRSASAGQATDGERAGHGATAGAEDAMGAPDVHQLAETAGSGPRHDPGTPVGWSWRLFLLSAAATAALAAVTLLLVRPWQAERHPASNAAGHTTSSAQPPASTPTPQASITSPASTAPEASEAPSPTASPAGETSAAVPGTVLHEDQVSLMDQDYLDVESGTIGEIIPDSSDLWYVSPYRALWTSGGGAQPITPVSREPTAKSCEAALKKRTYDQIAMADMKAGGWACALTVEGNLVGIQIRSIPPIGDEKAPLNFSYTVWQR
ncbi:hypothetical protein ABZW11_30100 [Nonomuraea sp. NPDC004580]|uniref:hypothetical protein n=1 Tax=Nonomuraea sp. NPDC004580 TaxID=3154552 RepID=UPI0033AF1BE7